MNIFKYKKLSVLALTSVAISFTSCDDEDSAIGPIIPFDQDPIEISSVRIRFEASGSLAFAPILFTTHSGDVDFFDIGSAASSDLEIMAELGNIDGLISGLSSGVDFSNIGGLTIPGASFEVSHIMSDGNEFFSYVGMLLPSSDTFIGNNNPTVFNLVDLLTESGGEPVVIEVTRLYDAGTEVNDFETSPGGQLVGLLAGVDTDGVEEDTVITQVTGNPYLDYLNPEEGFDLGSIDPEGEIVARITISLGE